MKRGEGKGGHFRERRHVENVLPRCCSRTRAWACKPREFNTLEMSNVEDKMSLGNGVSVCVIRRLPFFSLSLFLSPNLLSATSLFAAPCLFYASTNFRFYKLFANRYVFFFFHKLTFVRNKLNLFKSEYVNCMCVRVYNIRNDY